MKKQILGLGIVIISTALFSCSKEKLEMPNEQTISEEATIPSKPIGDPLTLNLSGRFEFNNSLADLTGQLATPSPTGTVQYGPDRMGNPNSSIVFQGNYNLYLSGVTRQPNSSVSLWIRYNTTNSAGILSGPGLRLHQTTGNIVGQTQSGNAVAAEYNFSMRPDNTWHHVVIAAESSSSKFYLDGKLVKTINATIIGRPNLVDYSIGSSGVVGYWTGAMDDLRFYSRTLTSTDVKALYGNAPILSVQ